MNRGQALYQRARDLIPGGTQLLSKRPESFLDNGWPNYYARAQGVEVEDLDGRCYLDMSLMGVGACVLGYADPEVDAAATEAVRRGSMCTLNVPEEVALAELLCELHPWASMARFTRSGGEAMAVAVRIARTKTGREKVAVGGYHGWHDWYLAANLKDPHALNNHLIPGLEARGVPSSLANTTLVFDMDRPDQIGEIAEREGSNLAAIVLEPRRDRAPKKAFLEIVKECAKRTEAVLIFDEITTGFRAALGGVHLKLGIEPDLAVFAKALANGYAMAAVVGTASTMRAAEDSFISSTNWTERIGPSAALATLQKLRREAVCERVSELGRRVQEGWLESARNSGLNIEVGTLPSVAHFEFEGTPADKSLLRSKFIRNMLARGYLASNHFRPSFAHTDAHIEQYLHDVADVFKELTLSPV